MEVNGNEFKLMKIDRNQWKLTEINGNGLLFIKIYIGRGGLEFGSGVTRSPGLVPLVSTFLVNFQIINMRTI